MICNNGECDSEGVEWPANYVFCPICGEELDDEVETDE